MASLLTATIPNMKQLKVYLNLGDFNFDPVGDREILELAGYARMARSEDVSLQLITFQNNPMAFLQEEAVDKLLAEQGDEALPVTVYEGEAVIYGRFPTREELQGYLGVDFLPVNVRREALMQKALAQMESGAGCCGGSCDGCSGCF